MKGAIVTLTGPSGSGKTTLARNCLEHSEQFRMIPSNTTREARSSDLPNEYKYLSQERFATVRGKGEFLWSVEHSGNWYGTLARSVLKAAHECEIGYTGIMILVPKVLSNLRRFLSLRGKLELHVPIFLEISNFSILSGRMLQRGDRSADVAYRLQKEVDWQEDARNSDIPYHYVNAEQTEKDVTRAVLSLLSGRETSL